MSLHDNCRCGLNSVLVSFCVLSPEYNSFDAGYNDETGNGPRASAPATCRLKTDTGNRLDEIKNTQDGPGRYLTRNICMSLANSC